MSLDTNLDKNSVEELEKEARRPKNEKYYMVTNSKRM